ncbi:MAG: hypothetical protein DVB32_04060, partial [Verrucomicrobia bacterium]
MQFEPINLQDFVMLALGVAGGTLWTHRKLRRQREAAALDQATLLTQARRESETILREAWLA